MQLFSAFVDDLNKSEHISEEKVPTAVSKVKSVKEVDNGKEGEKSRKSSRRSPSSDVQ